MKEASVALNFWQLITYMDTHSIGALEMHMVLNARSHRHVTVRAVLHNLISTDWTNLSGLVKCLVRVLFRLPSHLLLSQRTKSLWSAVVQGQTILYVSPVHVWY